MSLSDAVGPDAPDPYELLSWYAEMGVTEALDETPRDHFTDPVPAGERGGGQPRLRPLPGRPSAPVRPIAAAATAPDDATVSAKAMAREARTLDELKTALAGFEGCALKATAKNLVFADGNPQARLMLVGEAPGRDEDIEGKPFVGRSGKLLDRMLAAIGIDRTGCYIANVVPWRPPGNRTPTPQETAICLPFIRRQIELTNPDVLVCLGGPSAQTLLGIRDGITKARGRWMEYDTGRRVIPALATFHPAYLLRSPLGKRMAWRDMLAIETRLAGVPERAPD